MQKEIVSHNVKCTPRFSNNNVNSIKTDFLFFSRKNGMCYCIKLLLQLGNMIFYNNEKETIKWQYMNYLSVIFKKTGGLI